MNLISRLGGGSNKQRRIFPLFSSVPNLFNSLIPSPSRSSKKSINDEKIKFTNKEWEEDVINVVKVTFILKKIIFCTFCTDYLICFVFHSVFSHFAEKDLHSVWNQEDLYKSFWKKVILLHLPTSHHNRGG